MINSFIYNVILLHVHINNTTTIFLLNVKMCLFLNLHFSPRGGGGGNKAVCVNKLAYSGARELRLVAL